VITGEGLKTYKAGNSNSIESKMLEGKPKDRSFTVMNVEYDCPMYVH